jgi:S-adenosylmethionine decarboxylase
MATAARFAGIHLLVDVWNAEHLDNVGFIDALLRRMVDACGARLLNVQLHTFGEGLGVTGVATLSESHISIHTWPEYGYAAFDIFVCGAADPYKGARLLQDVYPRARFAITEHIRGTTERSSVMQVP